MTNEELLNAINLIRRAVADGTLQSKTEYDPDFSTFTGLLMHLGMHYRIKPQPREVWIAVDRMERLLNGITETSVVLTEPPLSPTNKWAKFREVLE